MTDRLMWLLDCYISRLRSLKHEFERVRDKDHPYRTPTMVHEALIKFLERQCEEAEYLRDYDDSEALNHLRTYRIIMKETIKLFVLSDRVDSPRIRFELLPALSWVASDMLQRPCQVIFRLERDLDADIFSVGDKLRSFNCEDIWEEVISQSPGTQGTGAFDSFPEVLIMGFPSSSAGSMLMHALSAHELAHVLVSDSKKNVLSQLAALASEIVAAPLFTSSLASMAENATWAELLDGYDEKEGRQGGHLKDVHDRECALLNPKNIPFTIMLAWLKEMFCDLVAIRLVGPSFLAAIERLVPLDEKPDYEHPAVRLRRGLCERYLKEDYSSIMGPIWDRLFDGPQISVRDQRGPLWNLLEQALIDSFPKLKALTQIVPTTFSPADLELDQCVEEMTHAITNLAPPSSSVTVTGTARDIRYFWIMVYAAWKFRLSSSFDAWKEKHNWLGNDDEAETKLSNLVLQGVRALELSSNWASKCNASGGV